MWLVAHLQRQLAFLKRSCAAYDQGYLDEAIRIAVVLRVLFHSTPKQTSLIEQMGAQEIELLSTCRQYRPPEQKPGQVTKDIFMGIAPVQIGPMGIRHYALLDAHEVEIWMPFHLWWEQVVFVFPTIRQKITRKIVATSAANKEGAHVDPRLSEEYSALISSPNLEYVIAGRRNVVSGPLKDAHFPALRQIAYEVLNSPALDDLSKLA